MSALDIQIGGSHYRNGTIQPVQYIEANGLQYLEGAVVKRVTRHDKVGGKGRQDIEKAIHELQLLLELRYYGPGEKPSLREPTKSDTQKEFEKAIARSQRMCLACGASDGHGGLQCPNTVATCKAQGNPNIDQAMDQYKILGS